MSSKHARKGGSFLQELNRSDARALDEAIELAVRWHQGQVDKAGEPYILHPLRLMLMVGPGPNRIYYQLAALFHDAIEDAPDEEERLQRCRIIETRFGKEVLDAVLAITRKPGEDYLEEFIPRARRNPIARVVKRLDVLDNMNLNRLPEITARDRARQGKYGCAMEILDEGRPFAERNHADDMPAEQWAKEIARGGAQSVCGLCGRAAHKHYHPAAQSFPTMVILCDGRWLKT